MTTRHPCPLCGAPLTYAGTSRDTDLWHCTACHHLHVARDCCDAATDAERDSILAQDPASVHRSHAAGLEGQGATQEPHDATEAAQRRVERYAEAIDAHGEAESEPGYNRWHCTCGEIIATGRKARALAALRTHQAQAVIAVADQEQAELRRRIAELEAGR